MPSVAMLGAVDLAIPGTRPGRLATVRRLLGVRTTAEAIVLAGEAAR